MENLLDLIITKIVFAQAGNVLCPSGVANGLVPCDPWAPEDILIFFISVRDFLLAVGLVLIIIFLVLSGIKFLTSRGNESQVEEARKMLIWSIVGAIVLIGAFVILQMIIGILRDKGFKIF